MGTSSRLERAYLFDVVTKLVLAEDPSQSQSRPIDAFELCADLLDVVIDVSCIYSGSKGGISSAASIDGLGSSPDDADLSPGGNGNGNANAASNNSTSTTAAAYDSESSALIQLSNGLLLYLKQAGPFLAFVCLLREENFDRPHLLDSNIDLFKQSLAKITKLSI